MLADVRTLQCQRFTLAEPVIHEDSKTLAIHPARDVEAPGFVKRDPRRVLQGASGGHSPFSFSRWSAARPAPYAVAMFPFLTVALLTEPRASVNGFGVFFSGILRPAKPRQPAAG